MTTSAAASAATTLDYALGSHRGPSQPWPQAGTVDHVDADGTHVALGGGSGTVTVGPCQPASVTPAAGTAVLVAFAAGDTSQPWIVAVA